MRRIWQGGRAAEIRLTQDRLTVSPPALSTRYGAHHQIGLLAQGHCVGKRLQKDPQRKGDYGIQADGHSESHLSVEQDPPAKNQRPLEFIGDCELRGLPQCPFQLSHPAVSLLSTPTADGRIGPTSGDGPPGSMVAAVQCASQHAQPGSVSIRVIDDVVERLVDGVEGERHRVGGENRAMTRLFAARGPGVGGAGRSTPP